MELEGFDVLSEFGKANTNIKMQSWQECGSTVGLLSQFFL